VQLCGCCEIVWCAAVWLLWDIVMCSCVIVVRYCDVQLCDCKYSYSGYICAVLSDCQLKLYLVRLQCFVIVGSCWRSVEWLTDTRRVEFCTAELLLLLLLLLFCCSHSTISHSIWYFCCLRCVLLSFNYALPS